ncbi:MAG: LapA family protein [Pseudomonadota bacterium]
MRIVSLTFSALIGLSVLVLAVANRKPVILNLVPEELAGLLPFASQVSVPLFLVILLGVLIGLIIGFVWEYLREARFRSGERQSTREVKRLKREIKRMRAERGEDQDEILALLDETP